LLALLEMPKPLVCCSLTQNLVPVGFPDHIVNL